MFTSSIIACAFINWQLTFITFTMGPVSAFVLHLLTKVIFYNTIHSCNFVVSDKSLSFQVNEVSNEELMSLSAQSHAIIEESILNVRTVQSCNGQNFMITVFEKLFIF